MGNKGHFYQEIAEALRRRILTGEFQPGDKLPPVREMARQWNCAPGTVSRAYRQLAQENLVVGHRGGGTQVTMGALETEHPFLNWAALVHRAERYLLEALADGHTPVQAQSALSVAIARWNELQQHQVSPSTPTPATDMHLRLAGSHDLTLNVLAQMFAEQTAGELAVEHIGSLGGLIALTRGEADVAGAHLWDQKSDTYNIPFVRRLFPGQRVALLTLAHRSLGLIVPAGNPQNLAGLGDLTRPDIRLVNRQTGSGTRVWLDAQLKRLEIAPETINGYEREELTHLAVARAIEQGEATVGLGIQAAAVTHSLSFLPLTQERYDLVILEPTWSLPAVQALVAVIRSDAFREAIAAMGGYDPSETGQVTWVA